MEIDKSNDEESVIVKLAENNEKEDTTIEIEEVKEEKEDTTIEIEEVKEVKEEKEIKEVKEDTTIEEPKKVLTEEERKKLLKGKLKQKINGKRTNRTVGINRKKSESLNDSMKKITDVLANQNITNSEQIDSKVIENVMNILNKQDIELLMDKLKDNNVFKELLNKVQDKYSGLEI